MSLRDSMRDATAHPPPTRVDVEALVRRELRRRFLVRLGSALTVALCTVAAITVVPHLLTNSDRVLTPAAGPDYSAQLTNALVDAVRDVGGPSLTLTNLSGDQLGEPAADFPYGFGRKGNFYGYMAQLADTEGYAAVVATVEANTVYETAECARAAEEPTQRGWRLHYDEVDGAGGAIYRDLAGIDQTGICVRIRVQNSLRGMSYNSAVCRDGLPLDANQLTQIAYRLRAAVA